MGTKERAFKSDHPFVICTEWQKFGAPDFEPFKNE